jgi:phage gpG-like protein
MIAAELVGGDAALTRLRAMPEAINASLLRVIAKLGIDLQRSVQQEELSGQALQIRSGSLQSSIDLRLDQSPTAATATVFTDSRYAGIHEYGFAGAVSVGASLRSITQAFGRPIAERIITVRAYRRSMNLPERSFLRSALEEMTPAIRDEVEAALRQAVTE